MVSRWLVGSSSGSRLVSSSATLAHHQASALATTQVGNARQRLVPAEQQCTRQVASALLAHGVRRQQIPQQGARCTTRIDIGGAMFGTQPKVLTIDASHCSRAQRELPSKWCDVARERVQQRGLAAAVGTHDRYALSRSSSPAWWTCRTAMVKST